MTSGQATYACLIFYGGEELTMGTLFLFLLVVACDRFLTGITGTREKKVICIGFVLLCLMTYLVSLIPLVVWPLVVWMKW